MMHFLCFLCVKFDGTEEEKSKVKLKVWIINKKFKKFQYKIVVVVVALYVGI